MLTVEAARARILATVKLLPNELIPVAQGLGRVLAEDLTARVTQPPVAVSAMDGYAVRGADVARVPVVLKVVGNVPAGRSHGGAVDPGECVRIFTGAPLPEGTDTIVIQENTDAGQGTVEVLEATAKGRYVRAAGLDFAAGRVGLPANRRLTARDVGLAAAMNRPWLTVRRRPRVAVLATGDEIVMPGDPVGPSQIVSSNALSLMSFLACEGVDAVNLGVAPDRKEALQACAAGAAGMDLLLTTGGASVGEHDLVQSALGEQGMALDFWKIAMRPGKPLMFGRMGATALIGLPGNPVSTVVCTLLFVRPYLRALQGLPAEVETLRARLAVDLPENDNREDYLRSRLSRDAEGQLWVEPFGKQDSSMLALLAGADGLAIRAIGAPPLKKGSEIQVLRIEGSAYSP
jgi:molybdopterin molybdotransferase